MICNSKVISSSKNYLTRFVTTRMKSLLSRNWIYPYILYSEILSPLRLVEKLLKGLLKRNSKERNRCETWLMKKLWKGTCKVFFNRCLSSILRILWPKLVSTTELWSMADLRIYCIIRNLEEGNFDCTHRTL